MSFYEQFEAEVRKYFDIPDTADVRIDDDATYWEGCPTCGGDYDFTVTVTYYDESLKTSKNPRGYNSHTYNGKMTEFLRTL